MVWFNCLCNGLKKLKRVLNFFFLRNKQVMSQFKLCTGILYSWFRASSLYSNKIQQDATDAGIYYCKLTLHVSGVYRTHHQEYIKL